MSPAAKRRVRIRTVARLHKSLTMWFNTVMLAVIAWLPDLANSLPQLQEFLHPTIYKALGLILVTGNILLRLKTSKPISEK